MLLIPDRPESDHGYFRPWFDSLGSRGVQLIYYDLLGMGRSARPRSNQDIDLDAWVAQAEALRTGLGHERISMFGHAWGGLIAQAYALSYANHLSSLILCCPTPPVDEPDNALTRLGEIATPTLVMTGKDDWLCPPAQAERIHAWLPNSTLVIFDYSGHSPFSEEPDKFVAIVSNWIAGLTGRR